MATVYAVASAKGGVGKTTTTAALATILSESGADVVAIDADLGMANLADALGVTPGETTVHDVLAGEADPEGAVCEGPAGLRVVPGATALDAYAAADPAGLRGVVEAFDDADYVFVDAGAGLSHDSTLPLAIADETLLVSTPERSALGDTEKTRQLTERLGGTVAGAAITRVDGEVDEVVAALLDAPILGRIPEDEAASRATAADRPLPLFAPDAPATRAYRDLTRALTGAEIEGAGLDAPAADAASATGTDGDEDGETTDEDGEGTEEVTEAADEDAEIVDTGEESDEGADAEADDDEGPADDEAEADNEEEAADDEDIIVADPAPTGVAEPTDDDEDIIVASGDETTGDDAVEASPDTDAGNSASEGSESEGGREATDGTDATDDEGAVPDATEAGDAGAIPDADETARAGDEVDGDDEEAEAASGDIEEELAGSIPFRDDDAGTMETALPEEEADDAAGSDEGAAGEETEDEGGVERRGDAPDDDRDDEDGGFFSRLFGR